jgi:hypothetical protein
MASIYGKADYDFVVLPHPIGNTEPVILKKWVEKIYPTVKRLLVEKKRIKISILLWRC